MEMYNMDFAELLRRLDNLEKSLNMELQFCEEAAEGRLTGYCRNGNMNFFQTHKENGKWIRHGITNNQEITKTLCRKAFIKRMLQLIQNNRDLLIQAEKKIIRLDFEEIVHSLPPVYQNVPEEYFMFSGIENAASNITPEERKLEEEILEWEQAPYDKSTYRPEERTNITSRGERVRSKGEVGIAEKLYHFNVPFRYEEVLHIGKYTFAPDFKPRRRRDGKVFYWEHCGMPFDENYMKKHEWKMQQYESAGIVPWDNLIVTYNDAEGNIDMRIVESEIVNKLL